MKNFMVRKLGPIITAGIIAGMLSMIAVPHYLIMPPTGTVPPIGAH
ncbi:MAG: hypothetical protein ACYCVB_17720 [Bacilli bacterium]